MYTWVPGKYIESSNDMMKFELLARSIINIPQKLQGLVFPVDKSKLIKTEHDLSKLQAEQIEPYVHFTLLNRYYKKKIRKQIWISDCTSRYWVKKTSMTAVVSENEQQTK